MQLFVLAEVALADVEDFFALQALVAFALVPFAVVLLFALLVLAINTNLLCGFSDRNYSVYQQHKIYTEIDDFVLDSRYNESPEGVSRAQGP